MTGDTAYQSGSQTAYGDLQQKGTDISAVFGPDFGACPVAPPRLQRDRQSRLHQRRRAGRELARDERRVNLRRQVQDGALSIHQRLGSEGLSEHVVRVRRRTSTVLLLTVAWADCNVGTASPYQNDHDAHWKTSSAEYKWLQNDLANHPNSLKFGLHYPLYADSSSQPGDVWLQGGNGL